MLLEFGDVKDAEEQWLEEPGNFRKNNKLIFRTAAAITAKTTINRLKKETNDKTKEAMDVEKEDTTTKDTTKKDKKQDKKTEKKEKKEKAPKTKK